MNKTICAKIIESISKKMEIFIQYENTTQELLICEEEEIEVLIEKRGILAEKIDICNQEIQNICVENIEQYPHLLEAVKNSCTPDLLLPEEREVFDKSQTLFTIINRIQNINTSVVVRLESMRKASLEAITASNNDPKSNLHKYLSATSFKGEKIHLLDGKYSKV